MVRDLMIDIKEHELLFADKPETVEPVFDVKWGALFVEDSQTDALICNVIIPEAYWSTMKYDDNGELIVRFNSAYKPELRHFRLRLVGMRDGQYYLFQNIPGQFGSQVNSYALSKNLASPIYACQLPYIDIDGEYLARMVHNKEFEPLDRAYIYSAKHSDLYVYYSDDQSAQLLSLCAPGKSYRYPTTGVGISTYLNCVVDHTDLYNVLEQQFKSDNKPIQSAEYDSQTNDLAAIFMPEKEINDTDLEDIANLNKDFFSLFTDDYVRRNTVLDELTDTDFNKLLSEYKNIMALLLFTDYGTEVSRIQASAQPGMFDGEGNIIESNEYFIITGTVEPDTIIMFDDEKEDEIKDAPVFIINDEDQTRLYTSLVEQPYWITENCHKCMIVLKRATVKYMIRQERYKAGKGLYTVPQTSANIKNMCAIVQDDNTGQLLGIVSDQTNISDISLDEITQHIYALKTE